LNNPDSVMGSSHLFLVALVAALLAGAADANAQATQKRSKGDLINGRPKVVDADLLDIGSERVRLWGIAAPSRGDWCYRNDQRWKPAAESVGALRTCLQDKLVTCRIQKVERLWFRTRYVAECWTDNGLDLAECMVRAGWATDYTCYSDGHFRDLETEARNKRAGLWLCDNGPPTKRWGRNGPDVLCEKPSYKPQGPGS
jgi:endonuclease YncB( thermonuclease family)